MTRLGACCYCGLPIVKGRESWTTRRGVSAHLDCAHDAWLAAEATRGLRA